MDKIIDIDLEGLRDIKINNEPYKQMWEDLVQVDGFKQYLEQTMALDIKRHFYTSKESQERVKGHFDLAQYLHSILIYVGRAKTEELLDKTQ